MFLVRYAVGLNGKKKVHGLAHPLKISGVYPDLFGAAVVLAFLSAV
jgi:hypothetical protein